MDNVMVAGRWLRCDDALEYDAGKLANVRDEVMASRLRLMRGQATSDSAFACYARDERDGSPQVTSHV